MNTTATTSDHSQRDHSQHDAPPLDNAVSSNVQVVSDALVVGADGLARCAWAVHTDLERHYHDTEWGEPLGDETAMFERVCLEGFQAGLSWRTVLEKREAFREAFHHFDVERVAAMSDAELEAQLDNPSIIRNRAKIIAARSNAHATIALRDGVGLHAFVWSFAPEHHDRPRSSSDFVAITPESTALAKALKAHGFKFIGPTSAYALMQAAGIVDDHVVGCFRRP